MINTLLVYHLRFDINLRVITLKRTLKTHKISNFINLKLLLHGEDTNIRSLLLKLNHSIRG